MACVRTILVLGLGLALNGCQMASQWTSKLTGQVSRMLDTSKTTVKPLEDGYFQVEIEASQIRGLGGPRSASLASYVDQEVTKSGLCKGGTRVVSEWWGNGYYGVKGQCK